jgi:uncharacterized protein YndB with AHSA1/START domain
MRLDVAVEELLPHPVEAVWSALTDANAISDWLMPAEGFSPAVGARFRLRTQRLSPDGWVRVEVTELEPPHRMTWAWSLDNGLPPTSVTFELSPAPDGTRLRLTHEGEIDPLAGGLVSDGWPGRIDELRRSLD